MFKEWFIKFLNYIGIEAIEILEGVYVIHIERTSLPQYGLVGESRSTKVFTKREAAIDYVDQISENWENVQIQGGVLKGVDRTDPSNPDNCTMWCSRQLVNPQAEQTRLYAPNSMAG